MAEINIDRRSNDGFGRYKMPRLLVQVEKRSRTVLCNLNAVAKSLDRAPTDLSKFFRCQLSTQVIDRTKDDRYIFSGVHCQEIFQTYLHDYIDRFVLCAVCGNPETTLTGDLKMDAKLRQICKACGYGSTIHIVSHKLATLRLEHATDQIGKVNSSETDSDDDDLSSEALSGTTNANTSMEHVKQFEDLLKEKEQEQSLNDDKIIEDIVNRVKSIGIIKEAPSIAVQCLLKDDLLKGVDKYQILLSKLCWKNPKGQQSLLQSLEKLFLKQNEAKEKQFKKKIALKLFLNLYDDDIVEEENFYVWHEAAEPEMKEITEDFIRWLRTAEESSGEEQ